MSLAHPNRYLTRCAACLRRDVWRRVANGVGDPAPSMWTMQTRGKKTEKSSDFVIVRLLKDMQSFGKAGTVVPVARGLMRNDWFKRRIANYVGFDELRQLKLHKVPIERDFDYGMESVLPVKGATADEVEVQQEVVLDRGRAAERAATRAVEAMKLTAERATELLEIFIPKRLDFYRQPVAEEKDERASETDSDGSNATRSASSAGADLLAARKHAAKERLKAEQPRPIYGSVSTNDVLKMVRDVLSQNDEAAMTALAEDDIFFIDKSEASDFDTTRIKQTGDHAVGIRVKGSEVVVNRTVRVIPQ